MATLSNLVVRISGNTTKLNTALTKAETRADTFKGKVGKAFKAVKKAAVIMGAAVTVAAAAFATGFGIALKGLLDTEAALRPMIQRSRIGAESLQALAEAAERAGSEDGLEGVVDSAQELQLQLGEIALTGAARASDALESLGLVWQNLKEQSPEEAFRNVLKALQKIPNVADRAIAAEEIFGGSSEKLAGIINLTTKEFVALEKEVIATSDIWSGEALDSAKEFSQALDNLKADLGRGTNVLVVKMLPALTSVINYIHTDVLPAFRQFKDKAIVPVVDFIKKVGTPAFEGVSEVFGVVAGTLKQYLLPRLKSLVAVFKEDIWPLLRDDVIPVFVRFYTRTLQSLANTLEKIVFPAFKLVVEFIRDKVVPAINDKIIPAVRDLAESILPKIKAAWENVVKPAFQGLVDLLKTVAIPANRSF